jgi:hypothetical protein
MREAVILIWYCNTRRQHKRVSLKCSKSTLGDLLI